MAEFKDLPENTSPTDSDIIAVAQDSDDVTVKVQLGNLPIVQQLSSTSNGEGASKVSIEDSGANFTSDNVEGALAELAALMDGIDSWVSATTYTANIDVVILNSNNRIYRCLTTNSDVSFDPSKWQVVGKDELKIADYSTSGSGATLSSITSDLIRLTNGSLVSIDMISNSDTGSPIWIINDTGNSITLNNENGATANQQIKTGTGSNLPIADQASVQLVYDTTDEKWQAVGNNESGSASQQQIAYITENQTSGTDGGTFTSGSYVTRALSNTSGDTAIITSLISNQFILPAGEYEIEVDALAFRVTEHNVKIRNITDSTDDITGMSHYIDTNAGTESAKLKGRLTLVSPKTFELQHRCTITKSGDGFGRAHSYGGDEIYAIVKVTKL